MGVYRNISTSSSYDGGISHARRCLIVLCNPFFSAIDEDKICLRIGTSDNIGMRCRNNSSNKEECNFEDIANTFQRVRK